MNTTARKRTTQVTKSTTKHMTYAQLTQELQFLATVTDGDIEFGISELLHEISDRSLSPMPVSGCTACSLLAGCINDADYLDEDTADHIITSVYRLLGYVFAKHAN